MITDLLFKEEARNKMKRGVDILANAVKATLGPMGRNVAIINQVTRKPFMTKDGVTVARVINLPDKHEDMGAQFVKMAAEKTAIQAGDGTTTSALLAQVIISLGLEAVENGANPIDIKRGIDCAVSAVTSNIKAISKPVTNESMVDIATISANNEREIGIIVSDALKMVGTDGIVYLEDGTTSDTFIEKIEGIQIDKGFISNYFINNYNKQKVEFKDALILLYERKISTYKDVEAVLNVAIANKKPLLIIAEDVDGEALATIVRNKLDAGRPFAAIKLPGFGNMQQQMLEDIAVMVGAKIVSPEQGHILSSSNIGEYLGKAKNVTISNVTTNIIGGGGKKDKIAERVAQVKVLIADCKDEYEADKLRKQRLAKLTNGVASIRVGAATDIELREKKDRIDDSVCATRAASEEGIVPGGGVAYIRCMSILDNITGENNDQDTGIEIIQKALSEPLKVILSNAGIVLADEVIERIISQDTDLGFNAKSGNWEQFFETGIIDPAKVSRVALENAASVAAMFLTTECAIVDV